MTVWTRLVARRGAALTPRRFARSADARGIAQHAKHHAAKRSSEMTVWTGFAFEPIDGTLQGLPLPLSQLLVPVPYAAVLAVATTLGLWTMYIHIGEPHLPYPLMGADYHVLHHKYNV